MIIPDSHGHPALARHTDNAEAMWSGLRTFCTLMMIGAWSIASQWDAGANALTLAAISCVLYSAVAAPFKVVVTSDAHAGVTFAIQLCGQIWSDGPD
ncbi:putative efflux pump protein [Escherichia coli]|nr:putative efflux pump protein [Escherichia coli]